MTNKNLVKNQIKELERKYHHEDLKEKGVSYHLDHGKNELTVEEIQNGTAGLLDSGTGSLDKVQIDPATMELVNADMGDAFAMCIYQGKAYEVKGKKLIAY